MNEQEQRLIISKIKWLTEDIKDFEYEGLCLLDKGDLIGAKWVAKRIKKLEDEIKELNKKLKDINS